MQRLVQLALDFFGGGGVPSGPAEPQAPRAPFAAPPAAPQGGPAPARPGSRSAGRGMPTPDARPMPVEFRHPAASREVVLGDALVAYALQRLSLIHI